MLLAAKTLFFLSNAKRARWAVSKFQLSHRISMSEKVDRMYKISLKNYRTKSRQVTDSRMILFFFFFCKNWT